MKAADIFKEYPVGRLLLGMDGVSTNDILICYIKDFVHMVYPVKTQEECNVSKVKIVCFGFFFRREGGSLQVYYCVCCFP